MPEPKIFIVGVYKPLISRDVYRKQWQITGSKELTQEHFQNLVLIEAVVSNLDGKLQMKDLGQPMEDTRYPPNFQCAYDEALLSADGNTLIDRRMNCVHGTGPLRFAFYLHFYDSKRPLHWTHGEVECPIIQPVPNRLKSLLPYRACN